MKNIFLLAALTSLTFTMASAKEAIEHESIEEAENFKIEKAVKEKSAGRAFAGSKAKKETPESELKAEEILSSEDSDLNYLLYSEEQ
jgi:hypothetical protein